jgi:hypothetical protein
MKGNLGLRQRGLDERKIDIACSDLPNSAVFGKFCKINKTFGDVLSFGANDETIGKV